VRIAVFGWLHQEPFARGMPASYWIDHLVNDPSEEGRAQAAAALMEIGPEVLPDLIYALKARGGRVASETMEVFRRLSSSAVPLLVTEAMAFGDDEEFRGQATEILLRMRADVRGSVPALIVGLGHPQAEVRRDAARLLVRTGKEGGLAVRALGAALTDKDVRVRRHAAAALAAVGAEALPALPALRKALRDRDGEVRRLAALAAASIGAPALDASGELLELLHDREARVRTQAARALGLVGADTKDAVEALTSLLKNDTSLDARKEAVAALGRLGPKAQPALPELVSAVFSPYLDLSVPALDALSRTGVTPSEVFPCWTATIKAEGALTPRVASGQTKKLLDRKLLEREAMKPVLFEMARDHDARRRLRACMVLVHVAPTARETAPSYREALLSSDPAILSDTTRALTGYLNQAVPVLEELLRDESPIVRQKAASIAGQIGGAARALLPAILARQKDLDNNARVAASMAQNQMATAQNEPLAALTERWRHSRDPGRRYEALYKIVSFNGGRAARDLIPELRKAVANAEDRNMRLLCVYGLQQMIWQDHNAIVPTLVKAMKDKDAAVRAQAVFALRWVYTASSPNETSTILALLKDEDWEVRHQAIFSLSYSQFQSWEETKEAIPALVGALHDPEVNVRRQAAYQLGRYGSLAREAVPSLVKMAARTSDSWDRKMAMDALGGIGRGHPEAARAALAALLQDSDPNVRVSAVWTVSRICPRDKALPAVERALQDSTEQVRISAADVLFRLDPRSRKGVPVLMHALMIPMSQWKAMAATTLGSMGPAAREAERGLFIMINDPNAYVRSAAITALANIGDPSPATPGAVIDRLLRDADVAVRQAAAGFLRRLGPDQKSLVPSLLDALGQVVRSGSDPARVQPILEALGNMGPAARIAFPEIVAQLKHADQTVRYQAVVTIARMRADAGETFRVLTPLLKDTHPIIPQEVERAFVRLDPKGTILVNRFLAMLKSPRPPERTQALEGLGRLGRMARRTSSKLVPLLADPAPLVRLAAAEALWKVARSAEGVPVVVKSLRSPDRQLRRQAVNVVSQMGPAARETVPHLIPLFTDKTLAIRQRALYAVGEIGPDAHDAVPAVVTALADANFDCRHSALASLGRIGANARDAVAKVRPLLRDQDGRLREAAATALGRIGPDAKEAVTDLRKALTDAHLPARFAAAEALWYVARLDKEAFPVLIDGVKGSQNYPVQAAQALGRIGRPAHQAASVLEKKLAETPNAWTTIGLAEALWRVTGKADKPVSALTNALRDTSPHTRSAAAGALGRMGPAATNALLILRALATDMDLNVSRAAEKAMRKIDPETAAKEDSEEK
jgi:HEAT repeat protein